jgi:hypothetical protein
MNTWDSIHSRSTWHLKLAQVTPTPTYNASKSLTSNKPAISHAGPVSITSDVGIYKPRLLNVTEAQKAMVRKLTANIFSRGEPIVSIFNHAFISEYKLRWLSAFISEICLS